MDYEVKKQLNILIQLAKADNIFTDAEKAVIIKIGKEHGAEEPEVREMFDSKEISDSLAPMTLFHKSNFLLDMIMVLLADKEIHELEEKFSKKIAKNLGFKETVIDFLLEYNSLDRTVLIEMMIPYCIQNKK